MLALPISAHRAASDSASFLQTACSSNGSSSAGLHTSAAPAQLLGGVIVALPQPILRAKPAPSALNRARFHSAADSRDPRFSAYDVDDDGEDGALDLHSSYWRTCLLDAELPPESYSPSARKQLLSQGQKHLRRAANPSLADDADYDAEGFRRETDIERGEAGRWRGNGPGGQHVIPRSQSEKQLADAGWQEEHKAQASAASVAAGAIKRTPSAPPPGADPDALDAGERPSSSTSNAGAVAPLGSPVATSPSASSASAASSGCAWVNSDASRLSIARGRLWEQANGEADEQPCALEL